jgi:hypothetical protein
MLRSTALKLRFVVRCGCSRRLRAESLAAHHETEQPTPAPATIGASLPGLPARRGRAPQWLSRLVAAAVSRLPHPAQREVHRKATTPLAVLLVPLVRARVLRRSERDLLLCR